MLPGRATLQARALRKVHRCFLALGSPFQSCVPESSGPVFSSWTSLLRKAGPKLARHLHCLRYSSKPNYCTQLQEVRCCSWLRCSRVALRNSHLLSLLGWRNVREKGFALPSYARCLCCLPRKGLALLQNGFVMVKSCFGGEIPLVYATNPQ